MHKILLSMLAFIILAGCTHEQNVTTETEQKEPVEQVEVKQEEVTETTPAEDTDGDGWVTYTSEEFGFSVEHPAGWTPQESEDIISFYKDDDFNSDTSFSIFPRGGSGVGGEYLVLDKSTRIIAGYQANVEKYTTPHDPKWFYTNFRIQSPYPKNWNASNRINIEGTENNKAVFDRILNSITFLN